MTERREVERTLAPPPLADDAHKGEAGRVVTICGSRLMPGAALLVVRAAQRAGAGLVTAVCLDPSLLALVPAAAPEAVLMEIERIGDLAFALQSREAHAIVVGCGLGAGDATRSLVHALLQRVPDVPLVLDADALNVLDGAPEKLRERKGTTVITPHPGEASRLLGRDVPRDAAGRESAALELARKSGAIVCLKGKGTVVTDGASVFVNDTGNAGMATAGAGDVLAGILAAYLAACTTGIDARWTPWDAACAAVHVHGLAGDLARARLGTRGLVASDLVQHLPAAQERVRESSKLD